MSWNGNREIKWYERDLKALYATKPELETNICGAHRIKRRERKAKA